MYKSKLSEYKVNYLDNTSDFSLYYLMTFTGVELN